MDEEPLITRTTNEARQGQRVKGMTTVLAVSIIAAAVLMGGVLIGYIFIVKG